MGSPFVKLFDGRVYVQFREVSDTLYNKELINWDKSSLVASSNHFLLNLAPLKAEEVEKMLTAVIMKNKAVKSLFAEFSEYYNTHIYYSWLEKLTARFNAEYGDANGDYYASPIEGVIVKYGNKWTVTSLKPTKTGILPPH